MLNHYSYLEMLYDIGIAGIGTFVIFLYVLIKDVFIFNKKIITSVAADKGLRKYLTIYGSVVISYLIIMISDNLLEYYDIGSLYWVIFAIASRIISNLKECHE